ncbi:MAG: tetratricopeptide repeat protein [Sediminibacterium sp.]|nr:tetratricopeptide repeat protein [Sediminibacterium sp.]
MKASGRIAVIVMIWLLCACDPVPEKAPESKVSDPDDSLTYLNHSDSAKYVGMATCKLCHQDIYNTFIKTGMGKSFDLATPQKSSGDFSTARIHDPLMDYNYHAYWNKDQLMFKEYRLKNGQDTIYQRLEPVNYIIGSGQHTNSHLQNTNGYIHQMPMTFYTQKRKWDLPPGFENGMNTRFSRKIGLECMSCHNAYPDFVMGSENKFRSVPQGIDCERCHGPGSVHVSQRQTGSNVDTSRYIDYSIVNPAKLPIDRQFDICQRCHLQGNAVLKPGKSFYDFKPGKRLSNYMSVFLPKYANADEDFIMASHADRLKQSACFIKSYEKVAHKNALRPYKDALTCITCHNPHVSVRETNKNSFNEACLKCHTVGRPETLFCTEPEVQKAVRAFGSSLREANCVSCHMPVSGSTDIPHVSVHDHYIRKPISKTEKEKIKTFVGLFSINEKHPDSLTKARAYLNQYDKFEQKKMYLDSAKKYLRSGSSKNIEGNFHELVQLYFIEQNFTKLLNVVNTVGEGLLLEKKLIHQSYENTDAWSAYRIAEAFHYTNQLPKAIKWFEQAIKLAPYNLDFRNKAGSAYVKVGNLSLAKEQYTFILKENPKKVNALTNLAYISLLENKPDEARSFLEKGRALDPDDEQLLLNYAQYYLMSGNFKNAADVLKHLLARHPDNEVAKRALQQVKTHF